LLTCQVRLIFFHLFAELLVDSFWGIIHAMTTQKPKVTIYTDGGCDPNPGVGGWAAKLIYDDHEQELSGGELSSTNNRMELTAAIMALESFEQPYDIDLHTDSEYLKKGITEWISGWIKKRWRNVKNPDLWQRLHTATQQHNIRWHWVKGHAGNEHNERVDQLAMAEIAKIRGDEPPDTSQPATSVIVHTKSWPGGWSAIVADQDSDKELSGEENDTTTYEMALVAAIRVLEALPNACRVEFYADNEIVQKGITGWIHGWMKNGWITSSGQPVKHKDLWIRLHNAAKSHRISWKSPNEAKG